MSGSTDTIAAAGHWTDSPCYYVSARDAGRYSLLAGPYRTHDEALGMVDRCRDVACELDPWAWFYAFGTCRVATGRKDGVLNEKIGLIVDRPMEARNDE